MTNQLDDFESEEVPVTINLQKEINGASFICVAEDFFFNLQEIKNILQSVFVKDGVFHFQVSIDDWILLSENDIRKITIFVNNLSHTCQHEETYICSTAQDIRQHDMWYDIACTKCSLVLRKESSSEYQQIDFDKIPDDSYFLVEEG